MSWLTSARGRNCSKRFCSGTFYLDSCMQRFSFFFPFFLLLEPLRFLHLFNVKAWSPGKPILDLSSCVPLPSTSISIKLIPTSENSTTPTSLILDRLVCLKKKMVPSGVLLRSAALLLLLQCCMATMEESCVGVVPMKQRREVISITDFGAVGDGKTLNTWPFMKAMYRISHQRHRGGTLLYVPPGVWLTGSFSLTSHMTLFLARGAVIKATQVLLLQFYPFQSIVFYRKG